MSVGAAINRSRSQSEQKQVYNPDLEYAQAGYAGELYGPNANIGSVGMTGGQYPTANKDAPGFKTGGIGYPGQYGQGSNSVPAGQGLTTTPGGGVPQGGYSQGVPVPGQPATPGAATPQTGGAFRYNGDPYAGGSSGARQVFGNVAFQGNQDTLSNPYGDYAGMLANPGYDQKTAQDIRTSSDTAARAPFDLARTQATRRAGITGDSASLGPLAAALAQGAGTAGGDAARAADFGIANESQRQKELALGVGNTNRQTALSNIQGMYGTEGGVLQALLSGRAGLAKLLQRGYNSGASTGGQVQGSANLAG
jgi:hypothetical protein